MRKINFGLIFILGLFYSINLSGQNLAPIPSISATGSVNNFLGGYTFAYTASGTPWNGSLISFGGFTNSYDTQINADYGPHGGNHISFRTRNGDKGVWNPWYELATKGSNNFVGNQGISGNVGIGTIVPTANLEIKSTAIVGFENLMKLSVTDAVQDYLRIANGTSSNGQFIPVIEGYHVSDNRGSLYFTGAINKESDNGESPIMMFDSRIADASVTKRPLFGWDSYGTRKMTLNSNGSLGIGTATTGVHKLAVEGSIASREVKVMASGWADFVFKKDYNLPTLEEVEKHIKEKGHLENIPSEKEVLQNGINLGEMNGKLLQKIEELTLYIIEMKKESEKQREEITILKNKILITANYEIEN